MIACRKSGMRIPSMPFHSCSEVPRQMRRMIREHRHFVLFVFLLFVARASLADHYVVPSGSMEYTLLPGDRVLVDKRAYGLRVPLTEIRLIGGAQPAAGEVVIFDAPDSGVRMIKRVVATGGELVTVRDGKVFINGRALARPADPGIERFNERHARLNLSFGGGPDVPPLRIPEGHVLVLGDARGNSRDGRWFGLIPESSVYARAIGVYYRADQGFAWVPL